VGAAMTTNSTTNPYRKHLAQPQSEETEILSATRVMTKHPIKSYFKNHWDSLLISFSKLMRSKLATCMTLIVIAIALALPSSLLVLLQNVKHLSQNWNGSEQVVLYLKMDTTSDQVQTLLSQIKQLPGIANAQYISPQQGLTEFENQTDFQDIVKSLANNPLPGVLLVQPNNSLQPAAVQQLIKYFQQMPQVDSAQFNMQWAKRLASIVDLAKYLVIALGVLIGVGILFIIGNTIQLSLQKYRSEIQVYKLVGATNTFIRRPFLYTGILYGLIGSIIAWLMVSLLTWSLAVPVQKLANLYNSQFHLHSMDLMSSIYLLVFGILLGILGAWLAVGKHLRDAD
jgi:cell division transport system permease protein